MAKEYRITVRGKQRKEIDADLFMQALVLLVEEYKARQEQEQSKGRQAPTDEEDA